MTRSDLRKYLALFMLFASMFSVGLAAETVGPHSVLQPPQQRQDTNGAEALRIFLDCGPCDDDFLRREITFVNYVRDRRDAQVHVLVTRETTGGGGRAWTLEFYGL